MGSHLRERNVPLFHPVSLARHQALGDIFTKEAELQRSIQAGLMGAITPALAKVGGTIAPVIEAMVKPLYKAYRIAVRIYMTEMHKVHVLPASPRT